MALTRKTLTGFPSPFLEYPYSAWFRCLPAPTQLIQMVTPQPEAA